MRNCRGAHGRQVGRLQRLRRILFVQADDLRSCCLFGYGRLRRVPVDVWIDRAIREECGGCEPFSLYGADAGVMQQYVFYAMRREKGRNEKKRGSAQHG